MNFIDELSWRGMLHDITPGAREDLDKGMRTGYIGFDPTAPSLTIGNYVQIMILSHWQRCGHKPIFLLGGATGRIGDPSGKDKERQLKSYDELDKNLQFQKEQASKFLNFDSGANKAEMLNNFDFYSQMNVLDFLRDVGKNLTVSYMMSKDSVKNRLEKGLSFTEFSYQLLQANDFLHLYRHHNCTYQMGGSDQWGNITAGTEFIRRNIDGGKAYAVTSPLLTKSDGKKFGKSEQGNIWLDPNMTSPYKFYQFWINADDADLPKFFRYFSFKKEQEIIDIEKDLAENPRQQKSMLAKEITCRVHSEEDYQSVLNVSGILFDKKASQEQLFALKPLDFETISQEIPSVEMNQKIDAAGINIVELLTTHSDICASNGDARRAIKNNAISVNKVKISDHAQLITADQLIHGQYMMIENGKKNKYIIKVG